MNVATILKQKGRAVATARPEASLLDIAQKLGTKKIGAIVVVGEVTRLWHRIEPVIQRIVKGRTFTHAPTRIIPTDPSAQPRLRGTIALVLQKHFGAPALV